MIFSHIEGATPIDDESDLLQIGIISFKQLCDAEAENILKAVHKYFRAKKRISWFRPRHLLRIHQDMFCDVWNWAGKLRRSVTNIGTKPYLIESSLYELYHDLLYWEQHQTIKPLECSVRLHHRLVAIHPFENGNGRHARLVADLYLFSKGFPFPKWPTSLINESSDRSRYLSALRLADQGDISKLLEFTSSHMQET